MGKGTLMIGIVDDDRIYRFTIEKYIQMLGINAIIKCFEDGEEALHYFIENLKTENKLPDILFLDVNMPIMDGWDFIEEYDKIKDKVRKDIRIYLVSSSIDERDEMRSKQYDMVTDYIIKPITEDCLKQLVLK